MKLRTQALPKTLPGTFAELAQIMVPHAIVDQADYQNTAEIVNRLAVLDKPTRQQLQYLDTLAQLIEAYDAEENAIDVSDITPIDLLKNLLADHGLSASDLGRLLGNRELGSKILRGERELSKSHIKVLADHFKLSPAAFID